MADSRSIPVRMPAALYDEVVASKPAELKLSTWLLMIIRKGLSAGVNTSYTDVVNSVDTSKQAVDSSIQFIDSGISSAVVESLQSRLATLEERIGATERIVDSAQELRQQAAQALDKVEESIQQAVDKTSKVVDVCVQDAIKREVEPLLEKSKA